MTASFSPGFKEHDIMLKQTPRENSSEVIISVNKWFVDNVYRQRHRASSP